MNGNRYSHVPELLQSQININEYVDLENIPLIIGSDTVQNSMEELHNNNIIEINDCVIENYANYEMNEDNATIIEEIVKKT